MGLFFINLQVTQMTNEYDTTVTEMRDLFKSELTRGLRGNDGDLASELRMRHQMELIELQSKLNKIEDIAYSLATAVRNVKGESPSTTGPKLGQILVKLRNYNGSRYDSEVLLMQPTTKSE